ncbi:MAG: hypothetical protein SGJ00_05340 [bacterium]|nr:hypothetical protein [bacterium]
MEVGWAEGGMLILMVYAWQSLYACFNNNPIFFIDPSGDEPTPDGKPIEKSKSPTPWKVGMEQSSLSLLLKEVVISATRIIRNSVIPFEMRVGMEIYKCIDWLHGRWGIMFKQNGDGGNVDNGKTNKAQPNMVINQLPMEAIWATTATMPALITGSTKTIKAEPPGTPALASNIITAYENKDKEPNDPKNIPQKASDNIHRNQNVYKNSYLNRKIMKGNIMHYFRDSFDKNGNIFISVPTNKANYENSN